MRVQSASPSAIPAGHAARGRNDGGVNPARLTALLAELQNEIRRRVIASRQRGATMSRVAGVTAADTIYTVDKVGERTVLAWFARHWLGAEPVELVMEGLEEHGAATFPRGTPVARTKWKCILDPIDGTRGLMYDKRSAWSLAALAPQRGAKTNLRDIVAAVMTELPTSQAGFAGQLSAVKGSGVQAKRVDLRTGRAKRFTPRPSRATTLAHGFASFAKFFPAAKAWIASREVKFLCAVGAGPDVFDDQYLSSGGQLHELLMGRDRLVADIRPQAFKAVKAWGALPCHPYDVCCALIAQEAGCVVESPDGTPLRAPLDTTSAVAWVGYANRTLARRLRPALRRVLAE
jgi:fructose-1,6-bisphosphatase/inositol monophosphatase family enzyme